MPCYHPLPAWRMKGKNADGVRGKSVTFSVNRALGDGRVGQLDLPCGRCVGCVQDRANEWALRCEHEAKCWSYNWFVTLTYEDMPLDGSLNPKHLQDFWKRLRKEYGEGVRYFACGEYGENFRRPHYHALIFNWLPSDVTSRVPVLGEERIYSSKSLERLWGHGIVHLAPFSGATAQYVTNYVRKNFSVGGKPVDFGNVVKPFQVMSRRPGIGKIFLARYMHDIYPDGYVTRAGGVKRRAPRFYDLTLEKENPRMFRRVKRTRKSMARLLDTSTSRKYVVEEVKRSTQRFFDGAKGRRYEKEGEGV